MGIRACGAAPANSVIVCRICRPPTNDLVGFEGLVRECSLFRALEVAPSQAWFDVTFAQTRADANAAPDFYWR